MNKNIEELLKQNPDLAAYISKMDRTINDLDEKAKTVANENATLSNENKALKQQVDTLQFTLAKFTRNIFGTRSEKATTEEETRNLFNFNEAEANKNLNAAEPTMVKVVKKRKAKTTRAAQLRNLESREVIYDLEESEKTCEVCDSHLLATGSKTRETIEVIKKAIKVMETSITYKCPVCEDFHKKAMPELPLPGGIATPSLLAQVIVDKTANALPLYRQSEDYKRLGLTLSRQTLSNWMIKSSAQLEILFDKMKRDLLKRNILHADETSVQVLKESGRKASQKSYMWTYVSSRYDAPIVLYEYTPTRAGKNPALFLEDFKGYLHVDAYKGYNLVKDISPVYCMAHLRRKFFDVYESLPKDTRDETNTGQAFHYCNTLYDLDRESRGYDVDKRKAHKDEHIKPVMEAFKAWLEERQLTRAQGSAYGKAIDYAVNTMPSIMTYLEDGRLDIDNNRAERAIKPFVMGRKNWLFSNTPNGAQSSAILYSIVQTCLLNEINPYKYLAHVLHLLANTKINKLDLDAITPYSPAMIEQFKMSKEQ